MTPLILGLAGPALTGEERAFFEDVAPAGYILFRRNITDRAQLRTLTDSLRALSGRDDLPILIDPEYPIDRDALYEVLKADGLHARRYFHPLISDFPVYRDLPSASRENLSVADAAADRILCLPIYPDLEERALARIVSRIRCP